MSSEPGAGHLTLLTQELNSSISNGPFKEKGEAIAADSDLRLNAWLRNSPPANWSEEDIEERGRILFKTAIELWPRPESEDDEAADGEVDLPRKGDAQFLEECRHHLNADLVQMAERLVAEIRKHVAGELVEGKLRNWTNHPENIISILIQNRDQSMVIIIKGDVQKFVAASLEIKPARTPYYSRFKLNAPHQLADAIRVVLASLVK